MRKFFDGKDHITFEMRNPVNWTPVLADNFEKEKKRKFLQRKKAVDLFLQTNESVSYIAEQTGFSERRIYQLLERCFTFKSNGEIYGYEALIPDHRVKEYQRKADYKNCGFSGAFSKLLSDYPELERCIQQTYFNYGKKGEYRISKKNVHEVFLRKCFDLGITRDDYPFISPDSGKRSISNYISKLEKSYPLEAMKREGDHAYRLLKANKNPISIIDITKRPLESVELDGHQVDAFFEIEFQTPYGDYRKIEYRRPWLLCLIDRATRCILGYSLTIEKQYNTQDVLNCIKNSIFPWKPLELTILGVRYDNKAGFPSGIFEKAAYGVFSEINLDNAKAHLSEELESKLLNTVGCTINFGPVATPTRRPYIERFFKTLEDNVFHRIPSTTGSNSNDPKKSESPIKNAKEYSVKLDSLYQILDVALANYNATPSEALFGSSPLELFESQISDEKNQGYIIPKLSDEKRKYHMFFAITIERIVRSNNKQGNFPHISYLNCKYTSSTLLISKHLVGKRVRIIVNANDLREIEVYTLDGLYFGKLQVEKKWRLTPHNITVRKAINKLIRDGKIRAINQIDIVSAYNTYLREEKKSDKKNTTSKRNTNSEYTPNRNSKILDFDVSKVQYDKRKFKKTLLE